MQDFREVLDINHLVDLGFEGPKFTWHNHREGDESINKKLDRYLANSSWKTKYPNACVVHGIASYSNHLPL